MELGIGPTLLVAGIQRRPVGDAHHHILQAMPLLLVIVHIAGGGVTHTKPVSQVYQASNPLCIAKYIVLLQLDNDILLAKPADIRAQDMLGIGDAIFRNRRTELSIPAASEQDRPSA